MHLSSADALFWAAAALCAVAQLALLHSFFLGASRVRRDAAVGFRASETVWAVLPAVILVLLLAGSWRAVHAPDGLHPTRGSAEVAAVGGGA